MYGRHNGVSLNLQSPFIRPEGYGGRLSSHQSLRYPSIFQHTFNRTLKTRNHRDLPSSGGTQPLLTITIRISRATSPAYLIRETSLFLSLSLAHPPLSLALSCQIIIDAQIKQPRHRNRAQLRDLELRPVFQFAKRKKKKKKERKGKRNVATDYITP